MEFRDQVDAEIKTVIRVWILKLIRRHAVLCPRTTQQIGGYVVKLSKLFVKIDALLQKADWKPYGPRSRTSRPRERSILRTADAIREQKDMQFRSPFSGVFSSDRVIAVAEQMAHRALVFVDFEAGSVCMLPHGEKTCRTAPKCNGRDVQKR